jgi:hypothetical protein
MEIEPIRIPTNLIREIPPPITNSTPPPVTSSLEIPVLDMPDAVIEYPTLDVPTQQNFEGMVLPPPQPQPETPVDSRDLPPPEITVNLPVVGDVPLPPVAPLITAGATAVVVATVTMGSTIILGMIKDKFIGPLIEKLTKPKKVKIKQKKPVLHFVEAENGTQIFEYSVKGTRLVNTTDNIEQYLRDQVNIDSLYEFDNKIIVDDVLKDKFTKEGVKRFKKHFTPAKAIVKKLSARLSF